MRINFAGALALSLIVTSTAQSQRVLTRAELTPFLTSGAVTEGFESFPIGFDDAEAFSTTSLDANTEFSGLPAGSVVDGIRFTGAGLLQVSGPGYFGHTSNSLSSSRFDRQESLSSRTIEIEFLNLTTAFGLDAFEFSGFTRTADVFVFGAANNSLGTFSIDLIGAPLFSFVGWQAPEGISRVVMTAGQSRGSDWSPLIDNVSFNRVTVAVPEPDSKVLVAFGLIFFAFVSVQRSRQQG